MTAAEAPRRNAWKRAIPWVVAIAVLVLGGGAASWLSARRAAQSQPRFVTEKVVRGDLTVDVTATGTLQPTNKVDVGSELSGTVQRVFVDINDRVRAGQELLQLDASKLRDQVERSRAALAVAEATLRQARATVREAEANLARLQEVRQLSGGKVPSAAELTASEAALARARAAAAGAVANVADARAALSSDRTNLGKSSIRSPIDGIVLSRNVDPGNAVAASLQAVTLFSLADDLSRMKLEVNVDEADVGLVREGQRATFTVSAYPARAYPARITRVSFGSTTKDNVVTYEADLEVANPDLSLRPGMSATATIVAAQRRGVLLVPNAALRFTPDAAAGAGAGANATGLVSKLVPRGPPRAPRQATTSTAAARQVWILQDGRPVPVAVMPGLSDGRTTEVASDRLQPGMPVILGQERARP